MPTESCRGSFLSRHRHHLIAALFWIVSGSTAFSAVLFGDDYYYAYFVKAGRDFFLSESLVHYRETNGRALVHALDELLIGFGLFPWRLFVTLLMIAASLLTARIACRAYTREKRQSDAYRLSLCLSVAGLSVLDVMILRQSVWWATGSLNYLFPAVLLLALYAMLDKAHLSHTKPIGAVFLSLAVGMSTEQAAFGALCVCAAFFAAEWVRFGSEKPSPSPAKPRLPFLSLCFLTGLAGFLTLYLAPGNAVRTTFYPDFYALSLFGKIRRNLPELISVVFGDFGMALPFLFCQIPLSLSLIPKKKPGFDRFIGFFCLSVSLLYAIERALPAAFLPVLPIRAAVWGLAVLSLLIMTLRMLVRWIREQDPMPFLFVGGALVLQSAMLISPQFGPRTVLISALLLLCASVRGVLSLPRPMRIVSLLLLCVITPAVFAQSQTGLLLPLAFGLAGLLIALLFVLCQKKNTVPLTRFLPLLLCAFLSVCCLARPFSTCLGYAKNAAVHLENEKRIAEYLSSGQTDGILTLYALPDPVYGYTMPYDNPYHMGRYRILYDIPEGIELYYLPYENS